jgi:hypothetical protein
MGLTKTEVVDIRIEQVLPYIANPSGQTLHDLLITIDGKLKESSPDAMAPGLINWVNKELFTEKWVKVSGPGTLTYNEFGLSKIGKGRFEINGTGIWEYNRFIAVSDTRGVTGKIYVGANNLSSTINVGVMCYDANKVFLGTNGGFVCNAFSPSAINTYSFFKSTAFGESASGLRNLKTNTRFVKLYIEVPLSGGLVIFDESEMTTFELDERYMQVFNTDLDWNSSEFFYTELSINSTFTFKNDLDGRVRTVIIKNTGTLNIDVNFPTAFWQGAMPLTLIRPGKQSIFTFIKGNGQIFASVIEEME